MKYKNKRKFIIKCFCIIFTLLGFVGLLFCDLSNSNKVSANGITEFYNGKSYFLNFSTATSSDGVALNIGYNDYPLKFITLLDTYDGVVFIKDISGTTQNLTSIHFYKILEDNRRISKVIWNINDGLLEPLECLICTNIENIDYILNSPLYFYVGIGSNVKSLSLDKNITGKIITNNVVSSSQLDTYLNNGLYELNLNISTITPIETTSNIGFMQSDFNSIRFRYASYTDDELVTTNVLVYNLLYYENITNDLLYITSAMNYEIHLLIKEQLLSYRDIAFLLSIFDFRVEIIENNMIDVIDSVVKAPFEAVFNGLNIEILGYNIIGILSTIILLIICFKIIKRVW